MIVWHCPCGWYGPSPSISDASYVRTNWEGEIVVDRVHIAVCPQCFHAVRRAPEAAPSPAERISA